MKDVDHVPLFQERARPGWKQPGRVFPPRHILGSHQHHIALEVSQNAIAEIDPSHVSRFGLFRFAVQIGGAFHP